MPAFCTHRTGLRICSRVLSLPRRPAVSTVPVVLRVEFLPNALRICAPFCLHSSIRWIITGRMKWFMVRGTCSVGWLHTPSPIYLGSHSHRIIAAHLPYHCCLPLLLNGFTAHTAAAHGLRAALRTRGWFAHCCACTATTVTRLPARTLHTYAHACHTWHYAHASTATLPHCARSCRAARTAAHAHRIPRYTYHALRITPRILYTPHVRC